MSLRISEFCGLTIADIDFKEKCIRVNHQLQRTSKMEYVSEAPKTEKSIRYVPMTEFHGAERRLLYHYYTIFERALM